MAANKLGKWGTILGIVTGVLTILGVLIGFSRSQAETIAREEAGKAMTQAQEAKQEIRAYKELDQTITKEFRDNLDKNFQGIQQQLEKMDKKLDKVQEEVKK